MINKLPWRYAGMWNDTNSIIDCSSQVATSQHLPYSYIHVYRSLHILISTMCGDVCNFVPKDIKV